MQIMMRYLKKVILFYVGLLFTGMGLADIPAGNVGEQAMMRTLRYAIDMNEDLRSYNIVLGAGMAGCQAFKKPARKGTLHVLITWQFLDVMKNLAKGTVVIMPEHAIDDNINAIKDNIHLITIHGVLHSRTQKSIQKANSALIDEKTRLIVMLAGDTEHQDGKWQRYTTAMVSGLIASLPQDRSILFLSGPRTGKYQEVGDRVMIDEMAHRSGTDVITRYVMEQSVNKPWKVVDFKFDRVSLWSAALKFCLDHPQTVLILPGESTSMISESLSLGIRPAIYQHPAMAALSKKYIDSLVKHHQATEYPILPAAGETRQQPLELQEKKVVAALLLLLAKKTDTVS